MFISKAVLKLPANFYDFVFHFFLPFSADFYLKNSHTQSERKERKF